MPRSRIEYDDSPADAMNRLVDGVRKGVEAAAEHWDTSILPEHFDPSAAQKYSYTKRSGEGEPAYVPSARGIVVAGGKSKYGRSRVKKNPKYFWQKQRAGKGTTPLVYSGELERTATSGGRVSSRVNGSIVEGEDAVPVPKHLFTRPKDSKVDKAAELTAVGAGEEQQLGGVVERTAAAVVQRGAGGGGKRRTVS